VGYHPVVFEEKQEGRGTPLPSIPFREDFVFRSE